MQTVIHTVTNITLYFLERINFYIIITIVIIGASKECKHYRFVYLKN